MTIASPVTRISFLTDGVSTVFPVNIQAYLASDFLAVLTNVASGVTNVWYLNNQYTLASSGSLAPPFWTLTTPTAIPVGSVIQVILDPNQTQQTQYVFAQAFPSSSVQQNMDRLTQQVLRLQDQVNRTLRAPDGDIAPSMQLVPAINRAMMYQAYDINGNAVTVTNLPSGTGLTPSGLGAVLYPALATESNVVNSTKPYFNVDRYGLNIIPGITPMDAAVQAAYNSASASGGGTVSHGGSGGPYLLNNPINCTSVIDGTPQVQIRGLSPGSRGFSAGFIINHNSIGFDCTGNDTISFVDVEICTQRPVAPASVPVNIPTIGILFARNNTLGGLYNRIIRTNIDGYFSIANVYNYASEQSIIENSYFTNYGTAGVGNCHLAYTAANYAGVQSIVPGLIATGSISMTVHDVNCCNFTMNVPNSSSDCIHLEGVTEWRARGGWAYNPNGRSIFFADNSFAGTSAFTPCSYVRIYDYRCENVNGTTLQPQFMILWGNAHAPVTHTGWELRGLHANTQQFAVACADTNTIIDGAMWDPITETQSNGISIGNLQGFSQLRLGATNMTLGNVTQGCLIIGDLASINITGSNLGTIIANNASTVYGFGSPINGSTVAAAANFDGNTASPALTTKVVALLLQLWIQSGRIAP